MAARRSDPRAHDHRDATTADGIGRRRPVRLIAPTAARALAKLHVLLMSAGIVGAAVILGAVALTPGCVPDKPVVAAPAAASPPPNEKFTIQGEPFTLEVARDDKAREKGLGGRSSLAPDAGMIFIFQRPEVRTFWMLDTTIDLDIIFVDPLGYVTAVHTMPAEPPRREGERNEQYKARLKRYPSVAPAQFAIELQAGKAKELGIKPNQKLVGEWERLKKLAR